ncbi:MAG: condensation domain-containing protein [Chitinophagales bacterium]
MTERQLGGIEACWAISCEYAPVNAVTMLKITGNMTTMLMRKALDQLQARHPITQTRLEKKGKKYFYRTDNVGKIPLTEDFVKTKADFDEIVADEYDIPFSYEHGPFIRIRLVHVAAEAGFIYIVTNYLHAIGDGESITNFTEEIMKICQKIAEGDKNYVIETLPEVPICEDRFPKRITSWRNRWKFLGFLWRQLKGEIWTKHIRIFPKIDRPPNELRTGLFEKKTDAIFVKKVAKKAKANNANLHGAICSASLVACYEYHANKTKNEKTIPLKCNSLVNLRPFLEPPLEHFHYGSYISIVNSIHKVGKETDFWALSRAVRDDLVKSVKRDEHFWFALYIEQITRMTANMEKEKMAALSVSNVGRMKFGQDFGPFQVVEYWGNVSNRGGGSDISLVVNSFNNQMFWSYTFTKPMVSHEEMNAIAERTIEILRELVAE